jgi:hypothetical protein
VLDARRNRLCGRARSLALKISLRGRHRFRQAVPARRDQAACRYGATTSSIFPCRFKHDLIYTVAWAFRRSIQPR